jgi:hypothetical protein
MDTFMGSDNLCKLRRKLSRQQGLDQPGCSFLRLLVTRYPTQLTTAHTKNIQAQVDTGQQTASAEFPRGILS